jgi:hypothetical protein
MVTNLTLEEGEQGLSAIVDPIRSRNVMETVGEDFAFRADHRPGGRAAAFTEYANRLPAHLAYNPWDPQFHARAA